MRFCNSVSVLLSISPSFSFTFTSQSSSAPLLRHHHGTNNDGRSSFGINNNHQTIRLAGSTNNGDNEDETTNGGASEFVDHAPCFDSVCLTSPLPMNDDQETTTAGTTTTTTGEAIARLGSMTGPTVWSEFNRLSQEHEVSNLGQGFPDWLPPKFAIDGLVEAALDSAQSPHQYTRTAGHPKLVAQLARRYSVHLQREIDPMGQVAVTVGASQALYLSLQTLLQPGDEVILFEPFFDLYVNQIKLAGGIPVYVPLTFVPYDKDPSAMSGGEWILESHLLENAITLNTRAIILNSPHNPTGKVFTRAEMESIATAITNKASDDCVVLTDEVYKYIVHAPPLEELMVNGSDASSVESTTNTDTAAASSCPGHVQFASLPNMFDRTITISSAGKTFSATGWQVGWCVGPERLITPIHQLLPYVQFCASTVIQEALARTLPKADEPYEGHSSYYEYLKSTYTRKRDLLSGALVKAGFGVTDFNVTPGGGFFLFARIGKDVSDAVPQDRIGASNPAAPGGVARKDWALCQWMAEEKGILCIPSSPFFSRERALEGASDDFVRIAFCKTDETIEAAAESFMKLQREEDAAVNGSAEAVPTSLPFDCKPVVATEKEEQQLKSR